MLVARCHLFWVWWLSTAFGLLPVASAETPAGKPAVVPSPRSLIAGLHHDEFRRREAAMVALEQRPTADVADLLKAALRDPETRWRAKRVLVAWATRSSDAHHALVLASLSEGKTARLADSVLNNRSAQAAHHSRRKRQLALLKHIATTAQPEVLTISQALTQTRRDRSPSASMHAKSTQSLRSSVARHLVRLARQAMDRQRFDIAATGAFLAHAMNARFDAFDITPEILLAHIGRVAPGGADAPLAGPALGAAPIAAKDQRDTRLEFRRELVFRWKRRFLWPARTFGGYVDPDPRARQLIFHSEDLRHVPEIWERAWSLEMPDVITPYRVHGGVISFEDEH